MRNTLTYSALALLLISCEKIDLTNNNTIAVGHGGMGIGYSYPLNSFESIQNCLNIGAAGSEIDLQMTKDSVLVAYHDEVLDDDTELTGSIYTKNWAEIQGTEYTTHPYGHTRIVSFDDLFSNLNNPQDYIFFFDCKSFDPNTSAAFVNTYTNALLSLIDKYDLAENVFIELKRIDVIEALLIKRPELKIFKYGDYADALSTAIEYNLDGLTVPVDDISDEVIHEVHSNGLKIAVFNAHSKERNIEALEKNVDYIQSDKLRHLLRVLGDG